MKWSFLLLLLLPLLSLVSGALGEIDESGLPSLKTEADETLLFFAFIVILCGAVIIVFIIVEIKFHWVPESVAVVVYGILIGVVLRYINTAIAGHLKTFDPELFFLFLLPSIIFESGFSLQKTPFFSNIGSILTLAIFGTVISFGFIGGSLYLLGQIGINYPLTLQESMTSGALLSTTDTVATLAIFQALNVDQQLYMIVFGESVLNDAVGLILFRASQHYESGKILSTLSIFFIVSLGSLFMGIGVAVVLSAILRLINVSKYPPLETIFMIMFSYMSYVLADSLQLSGIMSVFWCGVAFNHYGAYSLSPYTTLTSRQLFRTLAFVCETSVFIYVGISLPTIHMSVHVGLIFSVLFSCLVGRAIHVFLLCNILNLFKRNKLTLRMQTAIWWSGLMRGALAFSLSFDLDTPQKAKLQTATLIFVHFTLFAMGCGTLPLLKVLKIESASTNQSLDHISEPIHKTPHPPRQQQVTSFLAKIDNNYLKVWLRRPMPPLAQEAVDLFEHLVKSSNKPREKELPARKRHVVKEEEPVLAPVPLSNGDATYITGNEEDISYLNGLEEEEEDLNGIEEDSDETSLLK